MQGNKIRNHEIFGIVYLTIKEQVRREIGQEAVDHPGLQIMIERWYEMNGRPSTRRTNKIALLEMWIDLKEIRNRN